jgi:hypothetical protein
MIDIGLICTFVLSFGTGIIKLLIKYPEILRYLGVRSLPVFTISRVHDWSGLVMGILVLFHLLLNIPWLVAMTKNIFRGKSIVLLIGILLASGCVQEEAAPQDTPVEDLGDIDIDEYEGEKLTPLSIVRTTSIKGTQNVDKETYRMKITGLVETEKELIYEEALERQRYSKVVSLNCVEGWSVTLLWEGVLVMDLLESAGIAPEANTVIFYAYDGYSTSLPLEYIETNKILLAYAINDVTLTPEYGFPFQLVAEDKWGYKWIKWVTAIELSDDPSHRGYWERRGYNQDGDYDGPMFEEDE